MHPTDQIDKKTLEISQVDEEVYTDLTQLGDELPDHSPRYILLSYPLTMVIYFPYLFPYLPLSPSSQIHPANLIPQHSHQVASQSPT